MVELTEAAKTQLDGYFADKEKTPIRVFMASGG
jgi:iron-sulfur cluster assembly protein